MTILHEGCHFTFEPSLLTGLKITRYSIKTRDGAVGMVEYCPTLQKWVMQLYGERAATQEFTANVWGRLIDQLRPLPSEG